MSLHPVLLDEMLADEAEAAHLRLGRRVQAIRTVGSNIEVDLLHTNVGEATLRFTGAAYDAEPFQVAIITAAGEIAPHHEWPAGLSHGPHPILGRCFICLRGTYEYHCHPGHVGDLWAPHRQTLRLPQLLGHIIRRAGQ